MFVCLTDLSVHTSSWRNPQSGNSIPEIYKKRADLLTHIYKVKRYGIRCAYYKPGTRVVACKSSLKLPRDCRRFNLNAANRVVGISTCIARDGVVAYNRNAKDGIHWQPNWASTSGDKRRSADTWYEHSSGCPAPAQHSRSWILGVARPVADPAEGIPPPPPLFFDQNEAQRAKKKFFGDRSPPLSQGVKVWGLGSGSATEGSAFFDVRVCYPNAESYKGLTTKQIYRQHESEKKRMYARGVIEVEQGSFTPMERIIVLQFHGFASVSFALLRSALFLTCAREAHIVRQELRWTLQITTLKSIRNQRDFRIRTFNIFHI